MKTLIKLFRLKALSVTTKLLKDYVVIKYGVKSDVCIVTGGPQGTLSFQTSHTDGLVPIEEAKTIRRKVGESILNIYGLPQDHEYAPNVVLLLTPSALAVMKFESSTFIEDWVGESKVGDIVAVTYSMS